MRSAHLSVQNRMPSGPYVADLPYLDPVQISRSRSNCCASSPPPRTRLQGVCMELLSPIVNPLTPGKRDLDFYADAPLTAVDGRPDATSFVIRAAGILDGAQTALPRKTANTRTRECTRDLPPLQRGMRRGPGHLDIPVLSNMFEADHILNVMCWHNPDRLKKCAALRNEVEAILKVCNTTNAPSLGSTGNAMQLPCNRCSNCPLMFNLSPSHRSQSMSILLAHRVSCMRMGKTSPRTQRWMAVLTPARSPRNLRSSSCVRQRAGSLVRRLMPLARPCSGPSLTCCPSER